MQANPDWSRWLGSRWIGGCVAIVYLGLSAWFLWAQVRDATPAGPLAYAFTWDMFPSFATQSVRRVALGQTETGQYVVLHPSPWSQFREGVQADLTRADLDRSGGGFQALVESVRRRTRSQRTEDPVVRVLMCEQYWPVKFNLRDEHYIPLLGQGKPAELPFGEPLPAVLAPPPGIPHAAWRVVREYTVDERSERSDGGIVTVEEAAPP